MYVNVTFSNMPLGTTLKSIPGWTMTVVKTTQTVEYGTCGVGFACPVGTSDPVPCPLGRVGTVTDLGPVCTTPCPADHYCPNATTILLCPNNTFSAPGGWSQETCLCDEGYECAYDRDFSVRVPLNTSLLGWLIDADTQTRVVQAVFDAVLATPKLAKLVDTSVASA